MNISNIIMYNYVKHFYNVLHLGQISDTLYKYYACINISNIIMYNYVKHFYYVIAFLLAQ